MVGVVVEEVGEEEEEEEDKNSPTTGLNPKESDKRGRRAEGARQGETALGVTAKEREGIETKRESLPPSTKQIYKRGGMPSLPHMVVVVVMHATSTLQVRNLG